MWKRGQKIEETPCPSITSVSFCTFLPRLEMNEVGDWEIGGKK